MIKRQDVRPRQLRPATQANPAGKLITQRRESIIGPGTDTLTGMARKRRHQPRPGHDNFIPVTDAQRRAHADVLAAAHAGHGCDEHAGALCQAAEYYAMLGEHELADKLFQEALDDGGPIPGSVHGFYASFLFDQGRDTEAFEMIGQARRLDPDDPDVFNIIGETLLAHDHPQQAARWFTTGLARHIGSLTDLHISDLRHDPDVAQLARGRHQARRILDLPTDHIDELFEELQQINQESTQAH